MKNKKRIKLNEVEERGMQMSAKNKHEESSMTRL
jgi:hypothetical protein